MVLPKYILKDIDDRMKKVQWLYELYDNGNVKRCSGAISGNKVSAYRTEERLDELFTAINWKKDKTLFITLTHPYIKTEKGRIESWQYYIDHLPKFIRKLKAKGMTDFIAVKEAHRDGGCHVHILCQFKSNLLFFMYKNKRRLANTALRRFIKANWAGDVDIEGMRNDDIKGYIKKYLGKYSHIEDALRRAKRDWSKETDEKHKDTDCKKLWTNYYCAKLKTRRFTCSINKRCRKETADRQSDLVKTMNNPTADNKPKLIKVALIPWHIKYNPAFEPYNGVINPESREYKLAMDFLREN